MLLCYAVLIQHANSTTSGFNGLEREKLNAWSRKQSGGLVYINSNCCVIIGLKLFY